MKKSFLILLMGLLLTACGHRENENKISEVVLDTPAPIEEKNNGFSKDNYVVSEAKMNRVQDENADHSVAKEQTDILKGSKLIYHGDLRMQVKDYQKASHSVKELCRQYHGYVSGEAEEGNSYRHENTITLRVPSMSFDSLMNGIGDLALTLESRNVSVDDVTAQYVDVAARLKSKKAVEERYTELLSRAQKVSDVLEVEEQLRVIREEIESSEGQLKYWDDQVSWSTITVYYYESQDGPVVSNGFGYRLSQSFKNGWKALLDVCLGLVSLWPFWLFLLLIIFVIRYLLKRFVFKKK